MKSNNQELIIINGLPKSGFSLLGNIMTALGAQLIDTTFLYRSDFKMSSHMQNLQVNGAGYSTIKDNNNGLGVTPDQIETFKIYLKKYISEDSSYRLLLINDPFFVFTSPVVNQLLAENNMKPKYIKLLRHPWEVAQSLYNEELIPLEQSYILWLKYYYKLESLYDGDNGCLVSFDQLYANPTQALLDIQGSLNIDYPILLEEKGFDIEQFINPSLRTFNAKDMPDSDKIRYGVYNRLYVYKLAKQYEKHPHGKSKIYAGGLDNSNDIARLIKLGLNFCSSGLPKEAEKYFSKALLTQINKLESSIKEKQFSEQEKSFKIKDQYKIAMYRQLRESPFMRVKALSEIIKDQFFYDVFTRYDVLVRAVLIKYIQIDMDYFLYNYSAMQKIRVDKYEPDKLISLAESFHDKGFLKKFPIPLSLMGQIIDGSHRLSCAIYYGSIEVPTIIVPNKLNVIRYGREWFEQHNYNEEILKECDQLLSKLVSNNAEGRLHR